jgi:hypothetical protein
METMKGEQVEGRFQVRKSGPGYEWLPAYCIVDTEKHVRAGAHNDEAAAREHCAELNADTPNAQPGE